MYGILRVVVYLVAFEFGAQCATKAFDKVKEMTKK